MKDNDPRQQGERIVRVVHIEGGRPGHPNDEQYAEVVVVNHWNEKLQGRRSTVLLRRLQRGGANGYTKLSR